jgi:hypothetical protein
MIRTLAINLGYTAVGTLLISFLIYIIKFRRLPIAMQFLGFFLGLNLTTEILSRILFHFKINNLYLLHIYTFFEFLVWSIFYYYLIWRTGNSKKYFKIFVSLIGLTIILNSIFLEPTTGFNSNAKTLVQIILIGYAIYYIFINFGVTDFSIKENQSILWINFAVMLYYSGSLFIVMFMKMIHSNDADTTSYNGFWLFNALLNAIFQLLILISIWKVAFSKTKSLS